MAENAPSHAWIQSRIQSSADLKLKMMADSALMEAIVASAEALKKAISTGNRILLCGNGGSAADAQHIAAELSGRFLRERKAIDAEALHVNSSALTAVANDYGFDAVFSRMVEAKGRPDDVLIALSTSGNSPNILRALEAARGKNMLRIGFSGASGGKMTGLCDLLLRVPSNEVARIQECHLLIGHILCEWLEKDFFS